MTLSSRVSTNAILEQYALLASKLAALAQDAMQIEVDAAIAAGRALETAPPTSTKLVEAASQYQQHRDYYYTTNHNRFYIVSALHLPTTTCVLRLRSNAVSLAIEWLGNELADALIITEGARNHVIQEARKNYSST
jgi:hypothetical protein